MNQFQMTTDEVTDKKNDNEDKDDNDDPAALHIVGGSNASGHQNIGVVHVNRQVSAAALRRSATVPDDAPFESQPKFP